MPDSTRLPRNLGPVLLGFVSHVRVDADSQHGVRRPAHRQAGDPAIRDRGITQQVEPGRTALAGQLHPGGATASRPGGANRNRQRQPAAVSSASANHILVTATPVKNAKVRQGDEQSVPGAWPGDQYAPGAQVRMWRGVRFKTAAEQAGHLREGTNTPQPPTQTNPWIPSW
jgi:hypothetical protein